MVWVKILIVSALGVLSPLMLMAQEGGEQPSVDPESVIEDLNDAAEELEDLADDVESDGEYEPESDGETVIEPNSASDPETALQPESEPEAETEPAAEAATGEGAATEVAAPKPKSDSYDGAGSSTMVSTADTGERLFGAYKIHLGASKPEFAKSEEYELLYGNTQFIPTFAVEYFFFDWYATLGMILRMGYYKDEGHAVVQNGNSYESDKNGEIEITLIPLQAGITGQMTPFPAKWITLGGWFAAEATYFQEIRLEEEGDEAEAAEDSDDEDNSDEDKVLTNSGWRYGTNVGVSLSFKMNALDQQSVSSLRPLGLGAVYFTPFVETTTGMFNDSDFDLGRLAMGAAFTFETI